MFKTCAVHSGKNTNFRRITKYIKNTKFAPKNRNFEIFVPKKCWFLNFAPKNTYFFKKFAPKNTWFLQFHGKKCFQFLCVAKWHFFPHLKASCWTHLSRCEIRRIHRGNIFWAGCSPSVVYPGHTVFLNAGLSHHWTSTMALKSVVFKIWSFFVQNVFIK